MVPSQSTATLVPTPLHTFPLNLPFKSAVPASRRWPRKEDLHSHHSSYPIVLLCVAINTDRNPVWLMSDPEKEETLAHKLETVIDGQFRCVTWYTDDLRNNQHRPAAAIS